MSRKTVEEFTCNFCRKATQHPRIMRWFSVNSDLHACKECGHKIHEFLNILKIKHEFFCTEWADSDEMGYIET